MLQFKTTNDHKKFWSERKIDWDKDYLATWTHPHRQLIIWVLQSFQWVSLWEVGCGPGPNLVRIVKEGFKDRQLGGSDVNADAIALASTTFKGGKFHVESSEDMLLSDRAVDVMLSDAHLIYIGPRKIRKVLGEMVRISRNRLVLCEFNSTSWFKSLIFRWQTGYNAHNYRKLLEELGCYDIQIAKIPKEFWSGTPWEQWGNIITCKVSHI